MSTTAFRIAAVATVVAACGGARNPYDVPVAPPAVAPPSPSPPPNADPPSAPTSEPMEPLDPGPPLGDLPQLPPPGSVIGPDGLPIVTARPDGGTYRALTPEQIRRVVAAHTGAMRACHDRATAGSPKVSGKVVLGFRIEANGTTSDVSVKSSTLKLPKAESCMRQQVQSWKFPEADGPVVLSYPFVFAGAPPKGDGR